MATLVVAGAYAGMVPVPALADHSVHPSEAASEITTANIQTTAAILTTPIVTHDATASDCEFLLNLGVGAKGTDVSCLQTELIEAGFLTAIDAPTGNFGALTAESLKKWQMEHKIVATGYFGSLSRAAFTAHEDVPAPSHTHQAIDVSGWKETPAVTIKVHKDTMSGWNLEITPMHFTFAPEHVNGAVVEGEGHAHVYINDTKYARVYGPWMHLPENAFKKGENTVRVTLNANDHSDLEIDEVMIEAAANVILK